MKHQIATSIAKNTTVLMGSQAITALSSFVLILFLPRYLGTEEYGRLYLAVSIVMIAQIVMEFGGSFFIAKEIARDRDSAPALIANSIGLRSIFWIISLVLLGAFSFFAGYSLEVKLLIGILAFSKIWEVSQKVLMSCFQGFEVLQYSSTCNIAERVFLTAVGIITLLLGGRAVSIAVVMALSTLLSFLISVYFGKRLMTFVRRFQWDRMRALLRLGLPYFLFSIFGVIYYRIDAVMLSFWTPEAVLGWYGVAYRFFDIVMFFPSIFNTAVFPVLSRLWGKENSTLALTTRKSLELMLLVGVPIGLLVFRFSRQIIDLFFNFANYAPSMVLLQIFAIGMLLVYLDIMLGAALFASDRQRGWSLISFLAIFVNVLLNVFLIPWFQFHTGNGGIGAAIATLLTEMFVMVGALILMPKDIFKNTSIVPQFKVLVAGAGMALCLYALLGSSIHWTIQGLVAVALYGAILVAERILEPAEWLFVRNFFTFRNLRSTFILEKQPQA